MTNRRPMETTAGFLAQKGQTTTAADILAKSGMDWQVDKRQLGWLDTDGVFREAKNRFGIVRKDNGSTLGVAGRVYSTVQNSSALSLLDAAARRGEVNYVSAGEVRGGEKIWIQAKLPESHEVVPGDEVQSFMTVFASHDGKGAVQVRNNNIRMFCSNAYFFAKNTGGSVARVTHKGNAELKIEQAMSVIECAREQAERQIEIFRSLAKIQMNTKRLNAFVEQMFPIVDEDKPSRGVVRKREAVLNLFEAGRGNQHQGVRGTGWAAFNAGTEYTTHHMGHAYNVDGRFLSNVNGAGQKLATQAIHVIEQVSM